MGQRRACSVSISMRSSSVNMPFLDLFTSTATTTSSNSGAVRPMMSRCPFVTGSNEPGQTARLMDGTLPGGHGPAVRSRTRPVPVLDHVVPTPDGDCPVTLHLPDEGTGPWPAVILYPDAGGVRETFRAMADRLAATGDGYAVLLPDIYYRHPGWAPSTWPPPSPTSTSAPGS